MAAEVVAGDDVVFAFVRFVHCSFLSGRRGVLPEGAGQGLRGT
jgi:hypothetical protein